MPQNRITPASAADQKPEQVWNAAGYAENGRFVALLAGAVVDLLAPQPGEHILDLGCGDGALTEELAATGASITGLDASERMVLAARARGLHVLHGDAATMHFDGAFDAIFSNAALHWIPYTNQPDALAAAFRALKPAGRFVAEMGGQGNIAAIRTALSAVLGREGIDAEGAAASYFPSPAQYRNLLEQAGFNVVSIDLHPRPTSLPGAEKGMRNWLLTFRGGVLDQLPAAIRQQAVEEITTLLRPILSDLSGHWTADYVRLRFHAVRPH